MEAFSARNIDVEVKSSSRLDRPPRVSGENGVCFVSLVTTMLLAIAPVSLLGNLKRGLRRVNLNDESIGELRIKRPYGLRYG